MEGGFKPSDLQPPLVRRGPLQDPLKGIFEGGCSEPAPLDTGGVTIWNCNLQSIFNLTKSSFLNPSDRLHKPLGHACSSSVTNFVWTEMRRCRVVAREFRTQIQMKTVFLQLRLSLQSECYLRLQSCMLLCDLSRHQRFFFRPTPDGSRQVVYQAGKTIALCKFTELMQ